MKLFPEVSHRKFNIDGDKIQLDLPPNSEKCLKFSGLNLLTLNTIKTVVNVSKYEWFDASYNLISYLDDASLLNLRKLTNLDLSANMLEYFENRPFRDLCQLEKLNLSKNSIKSIPELFFEGKMNTQNVFSFFEFNY